MLPFLYPASGPDALMDTGHLIEPSPGGLSFSGKIMKPQFLYPCLEAIPLLQKRVQVFAGEQDL